MRPSSKGSKQGAGADEAETMRVEYAGPAHPQARFRMIAAE